MTVRTIRHATCFTLFVGMTALSTAQAPDLRKRLTSAEVAAVRTEVAGPGTSGLAAVSTRILFGDPTKPGLYTVERRVAPHTTIPAHTHRDVRTAVVVDGLWLFGYGPSNEEALTKPLGPGSFYTEPADQPHFARTGAAGATVAITGYGPTDTVYAH
jgi:quercetin dioxygenase-like cupin family protein